MFFLFTGKYLSFQKVTHKENCLSGQYLLKFGGLNHQNPIYNTIVNILLENPTLKWLSRWVSNLARLFLATKGTFVALHNCKKLWCHSILSQKPYFFIEKIPKIHTFPDYACIFFCHTWWKRRICIWSLFTEIRGVLNS